jgi:peptidoglycan hydrolase CwlO-like protein
MAYRYSKEQKLSVLDEHGWDVDSMTDKILEQEDKINELESNLETANEKIEELQDVLNNKE